MTPLEELQAAHARLSELRNRERVVPGAFYLTANATTEQYELLDRWYANISEKVEMLHRTIDAQLEVLDAEIGWERAHHELYGRSAKSESGALTLARAINGEAS